MPCGDKLSGVLLRSRACFTDAHCYMVLLGERIWNADAKFKKMNESIDVDRCFVE